MYSIGFLAILSSYYTINVVELDDKFLLWISNIVSISSVITIIFNGMLNWNLQYGVAFSGRINPYMYLPFIFISIKSYSNNKKASLLFMAIFMLNIIDIIWTDSRITILSTILIILGYIAFTILKLKNNKKKLKKVLEIILICVLLIRIFVPAIYIYLDNNFRYELNEITYKYTKKNFFSGRQELWKQILDSTDGKTLFGTGDVNYEKQRFPAHNEFLNLYYCWGLPVAIMTDIWIYIIARRAIKRIQDDRDLLIILCFISGIICTTFETYLYGIHFCIFNIIPISYILNRKVEENENNSDIIVQDCC